MLLLVQEITAMEELRYQGKGPKTGKVPPRKVRNQKSQER